jgi:hypothetical protein
MNANLLRAEIRAKVVFTVPPYIRTHDEWVKALDETTEGIMEVLEKYDIKERSDDE